MRQNGKNNGQFWANLIADSFCSGPIIGKWNFSGGSEVAANDLGRLRIRLQEF